jgi:hypothetical protein
MGITMNIDIEFVERMLLVAECGMEVGDDEQVRVALGVIQNELTQPDSETN